MSQPNGLQNTPIAASAHPRPGSLFPQSALLRKTRVSKTKVSQFAATLPRVRVHDVLLPALPHLSHRLGLEAENVAQPNIPVPI